MKNRHRPRILPMEAICGSCRCKTASHYFGSRRPCRVRGCRCKAWTVPTSEQFFAWHKATQAAREARA